MLIRLAYPLVLTVYFKFKTGCTNHQSNNFNKNGPVKAIVTKYGPGIESHNALAESLTKLQSVIITDCTAAVSSIVCQCIVQVLVY